jgi:HAD superfamily hydrolase (TIGR01484 family)
LLFQYRQAKKRLFMFDYDGTLTPIVKDPQAAIPSDRVIRTLKTLAADPNNSVWIISGRDQAFLDEWMGHISELGLSAEHGSFMRHPRSEDWENLTEKTDMSWQSEVIEVFQHYTDKTQGKLHDTNQCYTEADTGQDLSSSARKSPSHGITVERTPSTVHSRLASARSISRGLLRRSTMWKS